MNLSAAGPTLIDLEDSLAVPVSLEVCIDALMEPAIEWILPNNHSLADDGDLESQRHSAGARLVIQEPKRSHAGAYRFNATVRDQSESLVFDLAVGPELLRRHRDTNEFRLGRLFEFGFTVNSFPPSNLSLWFRECAHHMTSATSCADVPWKLVYHDRPSHPAEYLSRYTPLTSCSILDTVVVCR